MVKWNEKNNNKKWKQEQELRKKEGGGWNLLKKMELIIWSTLEGVWQSYDEWCKGERGGLKD